ncbi:hypothetical protein JHK87_027151 [Glycine soja]|nr:hypothetical protein JHK87_027151 [Glycine soja]
MDELIGSLKVHEQALMDELHLPKGKAITLKAFQKNKIKQHSKALNSIADSNVENMMRESSKQVRCYGCNKPDHIKIDCPLLEEDFKRRYPKKKAMMGTWDDTYSSSSEREDEHVANLCLITNSNKEDVFDSKSVLDFLNHKELEQAFNNLLNGSHILTQKSAHLKEQVYYTITKGVISFDQTQLENTNKASKEKVETLSNDLANFVTRTSNLDKLIGVQKSFFDKTGLGFNQNHRKVFQKPVRNKTTKRKCFNCNKWGHHTS